MRASSGSFQGLVEASLTGCLLVDLLYQKKDDGWRFSKSYYYKLAVAPDRIRRWLIAAGFGDVAMTIDRGLATIVATN